MGGACAGVPATKSGTVGSLRFCVADSGTIDKQWLVLSTSSR